MSRLALHYEAEAFTMSGKIMGRQSAGLSFLRAVADTRPERLWAHTRTREQAQVLAQQLESFGSRSGVVFVPSHAPAAGLREAGLLHRPDPGISHDAWRRLRQADQTDYSLCGVTHTINSHAITEALSGLLLAPLEPWDALICTSQAARSAVKTVLEDTSAYLRDKLGAAKLQSPLLPVIPLGVHAKDFCFTDEERRLARARLGLEEHEVAVLFAGRLIVHAKANPFPMWLALEEASRGCSVVLVQAGKAAHPSVEELFRTQAQAIAPSLRHIMVDGDDQDLYRSCWAASDVFTSLSDNFQETFGLTPIEAMSAALPVVVSDWDGYKDTVRDGIDGFRVPTLTLPPGAGDDLADRYDAGVDNFDYFSAHTSQMVAVDVDKAAEAYSRLIRDPALRRRMGLAGQERARKEFDWTRIVERYKLLWQDLEERRRGSVRLWPALRQTRRPDRPDPFSMFADYASGTIVGGTSFRLRTGADVATASSRLDHGAFAFARAVLPSPSHIMAVLNIVTVDAWTRAEVVYDACRPVSRLESSRALVWLTKCGILTFKSD